ncbi:hypothetical protein AVEN_6810-1 [Araneus ventricosus]|uniref:Uncharacterized protein n=1 Tax=Araneus ventricosus TaxID=182803 RepID=A0A4Y2I738_ARAVE|nr:hypothetical protein AVEN_6810-1 [Araneus ventricosus]
MSNGKSQSFSCLGNLIPQTFLPLLVACQWIHLFWRDKTTAVDGCRPDVDQRDKRAPDQEQRGPVTVTAICPLSIACNGIVPLGKNTAWRGRDEDQ